MAPSAGRARIEQVGLLVVVAASGMAAMALEMAASRVLGSVFGTSNVVWASIIGLMLIYLAVGGYLGGRLADRHPNPRVLYRLVTAAGLLAILLPLVTKPALGIATETMKALPGGVVTGSLVAVLILFSIPVTLLGAVSPFAVRLAATDVRHLGRVAGRVSALSTVGAFAGTFATVLYSIPKVGTTQTIVGVGSVTVGVGVAGLWLSRDRRMLVVASGALVTLGVVWLFTPRLAPEHPPNTVLLYAGESAYNYIRVAEFNTPSERLPAQTRILLFNEGRGIESAWHPQGALTGGIWDLFLAAPFFNEPPVKPESLRRVCIVGLAAGTVAQQYRAFFPNVEIDGVEIDPQVATVGRRFFNMDSPNLHVLIEDGRVALTSSRGGYDVVVIDAYRVPYVPWHLATEEFFGVVHNKLAPRGVVAINVVRGQAFSGKAPDRRLVEGVSASIASVFGKVHTVDVPGSFNTILVGTKDKTVARNLGANRRLLEAESPIALLAVLQGAERGVVPTVKSPRPFTDDLAPVEEIVNAMLAN